MNLDPKLYLDSIEKKIDFSKNTALSLFIICGIALFLRLYFFEPKIPVTSDALEYFWYANDLSIAGKFSSSITNNGWPTFLSVFFSIFHFNNFMDYMALQRVVTILISTITVIPVYLLCRRFFDKPYAILGSTLFAFEPRIIQNSLLGITEPLYIILLTLAFVLFLSSNKKMMYASFGITALSALVRAEGMFLFLALSIMFFVRYKKESKVIAKYALAAAIFTLLLLPMISIRIQTSGNDGLTSHLLAGASYATDITSGKDSKELAFFLYVIRGLENLFKYLGWIMIPLFIFFAPSGAFLIFKNRSHNTITIILPLIILSIPAFYTYSREIQETRYLYVLYPLFCVLSIFTVRFFGDKFKNKNIFLILLICGILLSSGIFLNFKKFDIEHEKEAWSLAYHVINRTKIINQYIPESNYIVITGMTELENFPILNSDFKGEPSPTLRLEAGSIEEYIQLGKDNGLTHLVVDNVENSYRPSFFKDIFYHEEKYPYLEKIFDSWNYGYKYHLKIYKIDYDKFDFMTKHN